MIVSKSSWRYKIIKLGNENRKDPENSCELRAEFLKALTIRPVFVVLIYVAFFIVDCFVIFVSGRSILYAIHSDWYKKDATRPIPYLSIGRFSVPLMILVGGLLFLSYQIRSLLLELVISLPSNRGSRAVLFILIMWFMVWIIYQVIKKIAPKFRSFFDFMSDIYDSIKNKICKPIIYTD